MGSRREPDTDLNSIVFSCTPAHLKDFFFVVQKRAREKFWVMRERQKKKKDVFNLITTLTFPWNKKKTKKIIIIFLYTKGGFGPVEGSLSKNIPRVLYFSPLVKKNIK